MSEGGQDGRYRSAQHRRQRVKNVALLVVLAALVVLFYVITLIRMGGPQP